MRPNGGQATVEFALLYGAVILPMIFGIIFVAEIFWVWHSVVDFTREGARYAATHCWQADAGNVTGYMQNNAPRMIDRDQFQQGGAQIAVQYFMRDPESGGLTDFGCEGGECSVNCVPDAVTVTVSNYEFRRFMSFLGLPPVLMPEFRASLPMESAGCDEAGNCLP